MQKLAYKTATFEQFDWITVQVADEAPVLAFVTVKNGGEVALMPEGHTVCPLESTGWEDTLIDEAARAF